MASWDFWVATENLTDLPKKRSDKAQSEGTVAPIKGSYSSPWIERSLRDCAKWLQKAPNASAINTKYFTAMDHHSRRNDTVLVCRVIRTKSGEVEVESFPQPTDLVALHMVTNDDLKFEERLQVHRRSQK